MVVSNDTEAFALLFFGNHLFCKLWKNIKESVTNICLFSKGQFSLALGWGVCVPGQSLIRSTGNQHMTCWPLWWRWYVVITAMMMMCFQQIISYHFWWTMVHWDKNKSILTKWQNIGRCGAYLIFVTGTTGGACVKKNAWCKFLQI